MPVSSISSEAHRPAAVQAPGKVAANAGSQDEGDGAQQAVQEADAGRTSATFSSRAQALAAQPDQGADQDPSASADTGASDGGSARHAQLLRAYDANA